MEVTTREAIRVLGMYTAGRFDIWALAGPARASCRAHVMSVLLGKKTPQAKSGVNAIRSEFERRLNPAGDCIAIRERNFIAICRATVAELSAA